MKLAQLRQEDKELIADYLKRASDISRKLPNDEIDVGMAVVRGMKDKTKREQVNFECSKDSDYTFTTVEKLVKAAYSEIGKPNPFDPGYKEATQTVTLGSHGQTSDEMLRQALANSSQALPAILQALRSMHVANNSSGNSCQQTGPAMTPGAKRDLSTIMCYLCRRYGHFAANCPDGQPRITEVPSHAVVQEDSHSHGQNSGSKTSGTSSQKPSTVTSNAVILAPPPLSILKRPKVEDYSSEEDDQSRWPSAACILPVQKPYLVTAVATNSMTAQKPKKSTSNARDPLQASSSGVKKPKLRLNPRKRVTPAEAEYLATEADKENQQPEEMDQDDAEEFEGFEEAVNSQPAQPNSQPNYVIAQPSQSPPSLREPVRVHFEPHHPPQTKLNKQGKVQELVPAKTVKQPDPIRGLARVDRLMAADITALEFTTSVGKMLNASDTLRQEFALQMQRSTPKYRVQRKAKGKQRERTDPNQTASNVTLAMAATKGPPPILAKAHEDDGQSQPLMVTSWVGAIKLERTLLDGGSIIELINRRRLLTMEPPPYTHTDGYLRVNLATDVVETLTNYTYLAVNVEGVECSVKAYVVDNQVYDLLLGIPWMRRVAFSTHYGLGLVTICGNDGVERQVASEIFPIPTGLPIVEIDSDDDLSDIADAACQVVIDEQGN